MVKTTSGYEKLLTFNEETSMIKEDIDPQQFGELSSQQIKFFAR